MKAKMPHSEALAIAQEIKAQIESVCSSVVIAGSIRRQKSEVGDIELLCVPIHLSEMKRVDLFTEKLVMVNQLERTLVAMAGTGIITPRLKENGSRVAWKFDGEARYIAATYKNLIGVDFFMVLPDRLDWYGWHLLLRTGPGEANQELVTPRWKGGLKAGNILIADGSVAVDGKPYPLKDEAAVFELWGFKAFIPAKERSAESYRAALNGTSK